MGNTKIRDINLAKKVYCNRIYSPETVMNADLNCDVSSDIVDSTQLNRLADHYKEINGDQ